MDELIWTLLLPGPGRHACSKLPLKNLDGGYYGPEQKQRHTVTGLQIIQPLALIQNLQVHSSSLPKIFQSALENLSTPGRLVTLLINNCWDWQPCLFEAGPQPHPTPAVPAVWGKERKKVVGHEMQATRRNCVKASTLCPNPLCNLAEMVHFFLERGDCANPWSDMGSDRVWSAVERDLG